MHLPIVVTIFSALLAAMFATTPAYSADFSFESIDVPGCDKIRGEEICVAISLVGEIEDGDTSKLQQKVVSLEAGLSKSVKGKYRVALIFLESPGGNINEAMEIGRFIRSNQISTQVAKGDTCASACVLVLASGVKRIPVGDVVIHSFFSPEVLGTNEFLIAEKMYSRMSEMVSTYLREMRVSSLLLEEMIRVPHFTSRKLDFDELDKLGLLGIDPVYAQARSLAGTQ